MEISTLRGLSSYPLACKFLYNARLYEQKLSEETRETFDIELRSFQLNKNLLEDLSTIVNDEYDNIVSGAESDWERSHIELMYTLKIKNKEKMTKCLNVFLKYWDPKNFKKFEIYLRSSKKSITIRCGSYWNLNVSISGNDSTWVSGLTKKFEEVLDNYKSKNEFYHKSRAYVIYFGIAMLIGFFILMIVTTLIGVQMSDLEVDGINTGISNIPSYGMVTIIIFGIMLNSIWGWASLFHWLFPKIELECSNRPKIRSGILKLICSIPVSLLVGWILLLFQ